MKKKLIAVTAAVCALAVLVIGSTFAFFTSKDAAENTFTMGNLKISVTEESKTGDGLKSGTQTDAGYEYTNGLPGDTFSKEPSVNNIGEAAAWIRVKIDVADTTTEYASEDDQAAMAVNLAALKADITDKMIASGAWDTKDDDGYLYYTVAPLAKDASVKLFETVEIPASWGNESANTSFSISISAQGVQSENNGATWDAADWSVNAAF